MFTTMRIFVLLFFIICTTLGGTTLNDVPYKSHVTDPSVYYDDKETYELAKQLPKDLKILVDSFYKTDHIINVKLDVIRDLQQP